MSIVIVIPSLEPANKLINLVSSIQQYNSYWSVVVVNDGSSEKYSSIYETIENEYQYVVLKHSVNKGKGAAIKTAINDILKNKPDVRYVITIDSDGQHTMEDMIKCIEAAKSCQSKTEFIKKFYGAYMKVMKNGWIDDIDDIFEKDESDTEKKLCDDYNSGMTLKEVSDKYNISTYRIVKIMGKYGIMPRNKGGLKISKKTKVELKANDGFHYVAIDRNTKFETRDYLNKAGVLTSYIRNQYHVDVPTIHFRKKYKEEHGKEWWEQWFDIKEVENKETRKWTA